MNLGRVEPFHVSCLPRFRKIPEDPSDVDFEAVAGAGDAPSAGKVDLKVLFNFRFARCGG